MTARAKFALLATLYLSQGLPYGFFSQALPALLRQQGIGLAAIGLTSMLAIPWALKFLWAPWVDGHGSTRWGRRKSWIVPLQLAAAAVLMSIAWLDPSTSLEWLLIAVFVTNLLAATQDIATDGLAIDLLSPAERGLGNGVQVAGYRVGMIIGGGLLLILFHHLGWPLTFALAAGILVLATLPILRHREARRPTASSTTVPKRPSLRDVADQPGMKTWLLVLLTYKAGDALATGMLRPFLVDVGLDLGDIGWLLGTVGFTAGLLGAIAGGWSLNRLGRRQALIGFGAVQAGAVLLYVVPAMGYHSIGILYAICSLEHFVGGMATAALFTLMMDKSRPTSAATDYTVQASTVVIATGLAGTVSGFSAQALGYPGHFLLAAALSAAGLVLAATTTAGAR